MDKILVAVDFSESALHAARYGLFFSAKTGAKLELVHVDPEDSRLSESGSSPLNGPPPLESVRDLMEFYAQADGLPIPEISETNLTGAPASQLLQYVRETAPDLVVVGRRGRGGIEKWLLGSVSERIILQSPVPVLVIPEQAPHQPRLEHLLYASDFEAQVRQNILRLRALFQPLTYDTHCVHVIEPASDGYFSDPASDIEAELREMVEGAGPLPRMHYKVLRGQALAVGLKTFAHEHDIHLLVLCPRRRSLIARWFQPRSTSHILQRADIPILTLPLQS
ncbi:MAG: universal stress protein [Bacteroidetes bacterium]|nr:MAG: universal stress protein [Bacteroidota bacterium]